MKTCPHSSSARAFSLIEMLVVITLVGVLTSLALSAYKGVISRGRNLDALVTLKAVTNAIQNYGSEYHRMPVPNTSGELPVDLEAGNPLLKILLGDDVDRLNPKKMAFLSDPRMGRNGVGGLVGRDNEFALVDPWGTPYRVIMDGDWDQRVANPDVKNEDTSIAEKAPTWLPATVIAYSAGADRKFGTLDDVVSWR